MIATSQRMHPSTRSSNGMDDLQTLVVCCRPEGEPLGCYVAKSIGLKNTVGLFYD